MASEATPFVVSSSFSTTPGYLASLEGLLGEREALEGLSFPISTTSEERSALELVELNAWMAGGYYMLSALLNVEETSTPAWLRVSFYI